MQERSTESFGQEGLGLEHVNLIVLRSQVGVDHGRVDASASPPPWEQADSITDTKPLFGRISSGPKAHGGSSLPIRTISLGFTGLHWVAFAVSQSLKVLCRVAGTGRAPVWVAFTAVAKRGALWWVARRHG